MTPAQALRAFTKRMAEYYNTSEKEIKEVLRVKFSGFNQDKVGEYETYLYKYFTTIKPEEDKKRFVGKIGDQQEVERLAENIVSTNEYSFPEFCPYHQGVEVYEDISWGRKGFRCPTGGKRCFIYWRAEQMAKNSGVKVYTDQVQAYVADGGTGDIEDFKRWLKEKGF